MVQVAILSGIVGRTTPDFLKSHPHNLVPVVEIGDGNGTGISKGYLRTAIGAATRASISDVDRGGYVYGGKHYRVIGNQLVTVSSAGALTLVGNVGAGGPVKFAESFDRLAINSGNRLYYLKDGVLSQVTDPDLGPVLSLTWSDGYFITTDGTSIVVTELSNPTSVDPLKYGSSEADPDQINGLLALRGEIFALNRYTIENFTNRGTSGFPFSRNRGAQIAKGCVGPNAFTPFVETFAFVGSARNEAPAVHLAGSGQAIKISPRAMDIELAALSAAELTSIEVEQRNIGGQLELLVHMPAKTWVYGWNSSQQLDQPVWYTAGGENGYAPRHMVLFNGEWWVGSAGFVGVMDETTAKVFGQQTRWRFDTAFAYNGGMAAIMHMLELVTLTGRAAQTSVELTWTDDGVTYSVPRSARLGSIGRRDTRPAWRRCGLVRNWRGYRFEGVASDPVSFSRLEAQVEALA